MGCEIKQIKDFAGLHWFVYVYVEFPENHKWWGGQTAEHPNTSPAPFAIRPGTISGNLDAMKDCHYWLKMVTKKQQAHKK